MKISKNYENKVSVIVAAYNVEEYIEKNIKSILNQSLKDIEIIIVNDGSTDETLRKIKNVTKDDIRVKIINKKNEGLIEARKTGLNSANGKYVLFVDGDDWISTDCCELLYSKAITHNADIVSYNLRYEYDNRVEKNEFYDFGIIKNEEYLNLILIGKIRPNIVLQFIKKDFLDDNNIQFPSNLTYAEDLAITNTLSMNSPKVVSLNRDLYAYYQRNNSITKVIDNKIYDIVKVIDIIEKNLKSNKLLNKYKEEFEYFSYMHLFHYRIVEAKYISQIHKSIYLIWKDKNIDIYNNKYYKEFVRSLGFKKRLSTEFYKISFVFGKTITNFKYFLNKKMKIKI